MKRTVRVVCIRHPEKDGDQITPHGAMQAFAAGTNFKKMGFQFKRFIVSGAKRTRQAAKVIQSAMDLDLPLEVDKDFHFEGTLAEFHTTGASCLAEIKAIQDACGGEPKVADGVRMSPYTRKGREVVTEAVLRTARETKGDDGSIIDVAAETHSPWGELAGDPDNTIFGLFEADAVMYEVEVDDEANEATLIGSSYLQAPIPGKRN